MLPSLLADIMRPAIQSPPCSLVLTMATAVSIAVAWPATTLGEGPDFATSVWPILEDHCLECHGAKQSYSNFRLDSPAAIRRGGELGDVLAPGEAEKSEIYRRASLPQDDLDFMPVDNEPLSGEQLNVLRGWIEAGADFGSWSGT